MGEKINPALPKQAMHNKQSGAKKVKAMQVKLSKPSPCAQGLDKNNIFVGNTGEGRAG
jgi:hypothetical protein